MRCDLRIKSEGINESDRKVIRAMVTSIKWEGVFPIMDMLGRSFRDTHLAMPAFLDTEV